MDIPSAVDSFAQNDAQIVRPTLGRNVPMAKCKICGLKCLQYNYYGVLACQGCKQFFRRTIAKRQRPECRFDRNCDIEKGSNCRHCRLKKCLAVGMDPTLVNRYFGPIKNENGTKKDKIQNKGPPLAALVNLDETQKYLNQLSPLLAAHHKIWRHNKALVLAYSKQFERTEDLLKNQQNILAKAEIFPEESTICADKQYFLEHLETEGFFSEKCVEHACKELVLIVELAKAMPFFGQLINSDQICLLQSIISPIMVLLPSYYSFQNSANTIVLENGLTPISIIETRRYGHDKIICTHLKQSMCGLVEKLHENCIGAEEFALFVGIICANSSPEKLSPFGRELLYQQCVSLTNSLHRLLQSRLGPLGGAQKFASIMGLLAFISEFTQHHLRAFAYMEVFYEHKSLKDLVPLFAFYHEQ